MIECFLYYFDSSTDSQNFLNSLSEYAIKL